MIFDTSKSEHKEKAETYFAKLIEGKKRFELKILHPKRSLNQNAYLHALFSLYGIFLGYTVEEVKTDIKIDLGYVYAKNGRNYLKHTSDMTTKELTDFIEKFRNLSAMRGIYLPAPHELSDDDLNEIARNQNYLTGRFEL